MKMARALLAIPTMLICAWGNSAQAAPGYRLVPLGDGLQSASVSDLSNRGELIGTRSFGDESHAFRWRAGTYTDLHYVIAPNSSYTQANGLNDRGDVVGDTYDGEYTHGFRLSGSQVSPITLGPVVSNVYTFDINNHRQILVSGFDGEHDGSFLIDGATVRFLGGLPDSPPLRGLALNERGAVAGNSYVGSTTHAVLWQDGAVMDLGVVPGAQLSFATTLNNLNEVAGFVHVNGVSHAMHWKHGRMSLLPHLAGEAASSVQDINMWGMKVGGTTVLEPEYRDIATVWWGKRVVDLDSLVRGDDPLKPYVHLISAQEINDRGDIVASGEDSRTHQRAAYYLTLFDN